ncbi:Rpn family recombination-promoting nuclease/putative transposase [Pseudomonas sp. ABC1]|uniref:Rpn family recombination-promoting nuclease/putative transposase n=1 Tax=Pseudomonas sp. ABC1 TaxID=2748080 RepID=UPI0015C33E0A|nr:Rpn family recombination-promoting nuclease/putative transposase [Pseudomonas sp. ABC1]QLF93420.1 Rpn family recombination-promoting nuclease/putative transposase [Pseudomonas sp. ABC1]
MPGLPLLDPKLDVIFKRLFAEAPELLADLINAVRSDEPPIVELQVLNPQIAPEELTGKFIVLDILARDQTGQLFNIEMQTRNHAGWPSRSLYYLARNLGRQLQVGDGYQQIQPVIGIHLMDFDLFEEQQACWAFELRDRQRPQVRLDRSLQLHLIELPKADRLHSQGGSALADWILYLKHWQEDTLMQSIERPAIKKAREYLQTLSDDDEARRLAFVRERALHDEVTEKAEAEARGRLAGKAEGKIEGKIEGRADTLRHLLQLKFGALPDVLEQRLQNADEAELTVWTERVLFAKQLGQVFEGHGGKG